MTVLICDRCGAKTTPTYVEKKSHYHSCDEIMEISKVKIPAFDENGNYIGIAVHDLCRDCMVALSQFMLEGRVKNDPK